MKKSVSIISLLLCFLMLFVSCGGPGADNPDTVPANTSEQTTEPDESTSEQIKEETEVQTDADTGKLNPRDSSKTYRVLMVGNSFSYYNDMNKSDGILYKVAKTAGYKLNITAVYKGGYYLNQFLDESDSYGKQVLTLLKSKTKYDIVIIQEQSAWPISNPKDFLDCCKKFKELCDANGAELWLYETWGYKADHSSLKTYGTTPYDMEMKLRAAYCEVGKQIGANVAYAGSAYMLAYKNYPKYDVYYTDSKHPSVIGSTLIAYTLFGTIFGIDPLTLTEDASLEAKMAKAMRECASEIVMNGAPVESGYEVDFSEKEKVIAKPGTVDASKTKMLTSAPTDEIISVIYRNDTTVGNGWTSLKSDKTKTFSGIRGTKDAIASTEYSAKGLTDVQKKDIADIGYGVSVIGIEYMDSSKKGTNESLASGKFTSVGNLCNGHWGSSYMAALYFDKDTYNIGGVKEEDAPYQGLITLNFGSVREFSAIGYFSGSLNGFAQIQDVYVSDDGVQWTKVESACYDATQTTLKSVATDKLTDPWNSNVPTVGVFFDMGKTSGQYIRIGVIAGGNIDSNMTGLMEINTRELAVFGK